MPKPAAAEGGSPIVLVANNPFGHHLLTSQLLDPYQGIAQKHRVILLCNGFGAGGPPDPSSPIEVQSYASSRGSFLTYLNLIHRLRSMTRHDPRIVFHIRGFVSGFLFWISQLGMRRTPRYIYDPRGAFFIEWSEAGRARSLVRLYRGVESRLVNNAVSTIVTSQRFAELYRKNFGPNQKIRTIYNSTSFPFQDRDTKVPTVGRVRVVYLGTFNYWHDMNEVARVMAETAAHIGPDRVEIFVYTLPKFHDAVRNAFATIDCAQLTVAYITYRDLPAALADKHIGVSVVRPTPSTRIASPIKIADYVALGLLPLLNTDIGDFDDHFAREKSAILYPFGEQISLSEVTDVHTAPNRRIYDQVSLDQATATLTELVELLRHG